MVYTPVCLCVVFMYQFTGLVSSAASCDQILVADLLLSNI